MGPIDPNTSAEVENRAPSSFSLRPEARDRHGGDAHGHGDDSSGQPAGGVGADVNDRTASERDGSLAKEIVSSVFAIARLFVAVYLLLLVVGYPMFVSNQGAFDFSLLDGRTLELLFPFDLSHRRLRALSDLDFAYFRGLQRALGLSNIAFHEHLARLLPDTPFGHASTEPLNELVRASLEAGNAALGNS